MACSALLVGSGQVVSAAGYRAEVEKAAAGDKDWLVMTYSPVPAGIEELETRIEAMKDIAARHNGEYDGWESVVVR